MEPAGSVSDTKTCAHPLVYPSEQGFGAILPSISSDSSSFGGMSVLLQVKANLYFAGRSPVEVASAEVAGHRVISGRPSWFKGCGSATRAENYPSFEVYVTDPFHFPDPTDQCICCRARASSLTWSTKWLRYKLASSMVRWRRVARSRESTVYGVTMVNEVRCFFDISFTSIPSKVLLELGHIAEIPRAMVDTLSITCIKVLRSAWTL